MEEEEDLEQKGGHGLTLDCKSKKKKLARL